MVKTLRAMHDCDDLDRDSLGVASEGFKSLFLYSTRGLGPTDLRNLVPEYTRQIFNHQLWLGIELISPSPKVTSFTDQTNQFELIP